LNYEKKLIKPIRIFKKIFGLVWFRFHKLEIEKPQSNQTDLVKNKLNQIKKIKPKKTKPNQNQALRKVQKNNIVFLFLI
jgi:hypothetical protein